MENEDTVDVADVKRWISMETIVSIAVMLVGLGAVYGSLSQRLDQVQSDVMDLKGRDITPGARAELARLSVKDATQDSQIAELRILLREQRKDILDSLDRLEKKLDEHNGKR